MKAPPPATRFLGHPVVAAPILMVLGTLAWLYFTSGDGGSVMLGIIAIAAGAKVVEANTKVMLYGKWRRAWDGMGEPSAPRRRIGWKKPARIGLVIAASLYALANLGDPDIQIAVEFFLTALIVWGLARLLRLVPGRGAKRADRRGQEPVVTLAIRAPLMPVPTLHQAYAALPEHCQWLLRQR